jgi:hypothetical protein
MASQRGGRAAPPELRDAGALIIASAFLGLHQGQDVSRSVLIGGFLALLIAAPLVRQSVKWSLKKARFWGAG